MDEICSQQKGVKKYPFCRENVERKDSIGITNVDSQLVILSVNL